MLNSNGLPKFSGPEKLLLILMMAVVGNSGSLKKGKELVVRDNKS